MSSESLRRRVLAIGEAVRRVAPDMLNDDDRAMLERLADSPTARLVLPKFKPSQAALVRMVCEHVAETR